MNRLFPWAAYGHGKPPGCTYRHGRRTRPWIVGILYGSVLAHAPTIVHAQAPAHYEIADLKALEQSFVKLAETVSPSVVAIQTYKTSDPNNEAGRQVQLRVSQGSGFVIDANGFMATSRHVLEEANDFTVILHNGDRHRATIVQSDLRSDLAVLKIDAEGLTPVRWGDVTRLKVGQWSFAGGNPFGLANATGRPSVTFGTISALGREMTDRLSVDARVQYYGNLIETSSAINPGSSGGPLFNLDGEAIGIVTAIATSSGVSEGTGFAIPVDKNTRRILETLQAGQIVRYGFMGITFDNLIAEPARRVADVRAARGVRITSVNPPDGPAAKAGLKPGDILLEVSGTPIDNADQLVREVSFTPAGSHVEVIYLRKQVKRKAVVTLGDRFEMLGLSARE